MFVQTQNWRELRVVLHKPSFEEEEGAEGIREGLMKPEVHPILSETIYPSWMLDCPRFVQRVGGRSRMCVHHAWAIFPTRIIVPAFI